MVAVCFQRDSRKDEIIVWGFILGTTALLGWAGVKRVLEVKDGLGVPIPGLGGSRSRRTGRSGGVGLGLGSAGLQQPRGGGIAGAGTRDEAARGAYGPLGYTEDGDRGAS